MKVLLHDNSLNLRGTSVAVYDYAFWLKKNYNIECLISFFKNDPNNHNSIIKKFEKEFQIIPLNSIKDLDTEITKNQIDIFYAQKSGHKDEIFTNKCKTAIHAVFPTPSEHAHGDVYAYISDWLAETCSNNTLPFVPYMLNLPLVDKKLNFKQQLNIPKHAKVFGRHGGFDSFDILFVQKAIQTLVNNDKNIYFIFCNTPQFINHPQVIFTNCVISLKDKVKFVNTCDAMLHARFRGETFGLAVLEFISQNKPVFTYKNSSEGHHYKMLENSGYLYTDEQNLIEQISSFVPHDITYTCVQNFTPTNTIKKFYNTFIS
jgi:hypothetical protein